MRAIYTSLFLSLTCVTSYAADSQRLVTPYSPAMGAIDAYSSEPWSRPYVGIAAGVSSSDRDYVLRTPMAPDSKAHSTGGGVDFGIRAGYDHQQDNFLIGAVADFSFASIRSAVSGSIGALGLAGSLESRIDNLATLRIRTGFLPHKNVLAYIHGGGALGNVSILENGAPSPGINNDPRYGYIVGGGVEYAIGANITLNTEYSYLNLGETHLINYGTSGLYETIDAHRITSGVNFRF